MTFSNISPELKKRIKKLTMQFTDRPQPELLIAVPNPKPNIEYEIKTVYPEFTSLCPLALTQPDFATITISYRPSKTVIELKSLKFYLTSFRTVDIFHEAVVGVILEDLVNACHPKRMKVEAVFSTRGGIDTTVTAEYVDEH